MNIQPVVSVVTRRFGLMPDGIGVTMTTESFHACFPVLLQQPH